MEAACIAFRARWRWLQSLVAHTDRQTISSVKVWESGTALEQPSRGAQERPAAGLPENRLREGRHLPALQFVPGRALQASRNECIRSTSG